MVNEPRIWTGVEPIPTVTSNEKVLPAEGSSFGAAAVGRGSSGATRAGGWVVAVAMSGCGDCGAIGNADTSTSVIWSYSKSVPLAASSATIEMLYLVLYWASVCIAVAYWLTASK